jgi:hypothetical protein
MGVLGDINDPKAAPQWLELQDAGRALGIDVIAAEARTPNDLAGAFQALADQRPDAVIVLQTSMLLSERRKIADLEAATRLPVIYGYREHVVDGGLISYGVDLRDCFRRSAVYVVKILNGTAPGDLPVAVSDQSGADYQPENSQGARDRNSPDPTRPGRRGDRMNEAVSYVCTFETCANDACRVRLWSKLKAESDPTRTWTR